MRKQYGLVLILAIFLGACAGTPQWDVRLDPQSIAAGSGKIGVFMTAVPQPNTFFPGANCLLCIGVAEAAHGKLSTHTKTLAVDDLTRLKADLVEAINKAGGTAIAIDEPIAVNKLKKAGTKGPNIALKDFGPLAAQHGIQKALVIEVAFLGFSRPYASYIPTGVPSAFIEGKSYLVNLSNNTYESYTDLKSEKVAEGPWDEPPQYPGLSNAYFSVLEGTRDRVLRPITKP